MRKDALHSMNWKRWLYQNDIKMYVCSTASFFNHDVMAVIDRERGRSPRQFHLQTLKPLFLSRLEKPSSIQRARVSMVGHGEEKSCDITTFSSIIFPNKFLIVDICDLLYIYI